MSSLYFADHKFYRYLVEEPGRDDWLLRYPHRRGNLIVARDLSSEEGGKKCFAIFESIAKFFIWNSTLPLTERTLYEVILDGLQKPHFDVDIEVDSADILECEYTVVRDALRSAITVELDGKIEYDESTDLMITSSHGLQKRSYHFIITNLYHNNCSEAKSFYQAVVGRIDERYRKYIDSAVYSKTQQFRLLGHSKRGANRIKILESYGGTLNGTRENVRSLELLEASLISNTYECQCIPGYEVKKTTDTVFLPMTESDHSALIEAWNTTPMCKDFDVSHATGGLIKLKRIRPGYCPIHERIHDSDNGYLFSGGDRFYYGCHRGGSALDIGGVNQLASVSTYNPKEKYYLQDYCNDCEHATFEGSDREDATIKAYKFMKPLLLRVGRSFTANKRVFIMKINKDNIFEMTSAKPTRTFSAYGVSIKWPGGTDTINYFTQLESKDRDFQVQLIDMMPYVGVDPLPHPSFNLFPGFRATLLPTYNLRRIERILYHIRYVLSGGDENVYRYIISWLAWLIQDHTGSRYQTGVILILYGASGSGKTIIADWFARYVIGRNLSASMSGFSKLTGKFNCLLAGKVLCVINEAGCGEGYKDYNGAFETLKTIISDDYVAVEPKGIDPYCIANITNYICSTNHSAPIKMVDGMDRRVLMVECNDMHVKDKMYFKKLVENPEETADHFMSYLYQLPASEQVDLADIPQTAIKTEATELSLSVQLRFVMALSRGEYYFPERYLHLIEHEVVISNNDLFQLYREYCGEQGVTNVGTATKFGTAIGSSKMFTAKLRNIKGIRTRARTIEYNSDTMVVRTDFESSRAVPMKEWIKTKC
jgi:hypothetical protein